MEGEAIAGGAIERWLVAVGNERTGEYTTVGREEWKLLFAGSREAAGLRDDEVACYLEVQNGVHS